MKYIIKTSIVAAAAFAAFLPGCSNQNYKFKVNQPKKAQIIENVNKSYIKASGSVDKDVLDLKMMKAVTDPIQKMINTYMSDLDELDQETAELSHLCK